jgi:hypothetical protein
MSWGEQIFRYCERGHDPGLLAEPLNVLSNLAFLAAAIVAARQLRAPHSLCATSRSGSESGRTVDATCAAAWVMILLVALIGVGSFLFHVTATRWARLADVIPITAFMLVYLAFALRVLLEQSWAAVGIGLGAFVLALAAASNLCPADDPSVPGCLNGTMAYAPALLALAGVGAVLRRRGHADAGALLAAAGIFLISMAMRSADVDLCEATRIAGHATGLHVLWHLFNAAALYLLLRVPIGEVHRRIALPG